MRTLSVDRAFTGINSRSHGNSGKRSLWSTGPPALGSTIPQRPERQGNAQILAEPEQGESGRKYDNSESLVCTREFRLSVICNDCGLVSYNRPSGTNLNRKLLAGPMVLKGQNMDEALKARLDEARRRMNSQQAGI